MNSHRPSHSGSRHTKSTVPTGTSPKIKRSSAYDEDFEQHLVDHHIYTEGYNYSDDYPTPEPSNLQGFYQRLAQRRPSLSPSHFTTSDFRHFKQNNGRALSERKIMSSVIPVISGSSDYVNEEDLLFTRLESITGGTTVNPQPDFYDGARSGDLEQQVREDLAQYIIPTKHFTAPIAPNFFLEVKAVDAGAQIVKRQACYNGAIGARVMHQLQSYGHDEPVYDDNAYTFTSTYHAGTGTLQMYVTHPTEGPEGSTEYHMTQVNTWALTGNANSFRQGATAFRNARDWAQEKRNEFISAANERANERANAAPSPIELPDLDHDSDPSDVEDAGHLELPNENAKTKPSSFGSSNYNNHSNMETLQGSDTSADGLALDVHATPATSSKRQQDKSK